jgi:hypothetical protein
MTVPKNRPRPNLRHVCEPEDPAPADGIQWGALADKHGLPADWLTPEQRRIVVPRQFNPAQRAEGARREHRVSQLRAWGVPGDVIAKLQDPAMVRETQAMQGARSILREHAAGRVWGLLVGGLGAGKSFAAGWWLTMVRTSAGSAPRRFVTAAEIHSLPHGTVFAAERLEALCHAQALVIDDVGALDGDGETMSPAVQRILFKRYQDRLPTFLTANMDPRTDWPRYLHDPRLLDRWTEIGVARMTRDETLRRLHAQRGTR